MSEISQAPQQAPTTRRKALGGFPSDTKVLNQSAAMLLARPL
ncbi:hypothetical protein [Streptomyces sp. CS227]|nr:hypothetical protein [Streptomyces sp. CS227]